MRLGRRERKLSIVLGLALLGLAADRLLLGHGPQAANAGLYVREGVPTSGDLLKREPPQGRAPLPEVGPVADVFSWSRVVAPATPVTAPPPSPEQASDEAIARFQQSYTLRATLHGREPCVIVNDILLRPGNVIDGFRLIEIGDRQAVFDYRGARCVLRIAPSAENSGPRPEGPSAP